MAQVTDDREYRNRERKGIQETIEGGKIAMRGALVWIRGLGRPTTSLADPIGRTGKTLFPHAIIYIQYAISS